MRALLLIVLVAACKKEAAPPQVATPKTAEPAKPSAPTTAIHEAVVHEGFIVVVPKGADIKAIEAGARARIEKLGGTVEEMKEPAVGEQERVIFRYANPDLTDADLDAIAAGTAFAILLEGEPVATLRAIAPIAHDIASSAHGWVVDPIAGSAYTPAQFVKRMPGDPLDVRTQIYVHGVGGEGDLPVLDTMGMYKLGFPELMVAAAAGSQVDEMTILIDATAQTLLAHPDVKVPGSIDVDLAALPGEWHVDAIRKNGGTARVHWLARWSTGEGHAEDEPEIELVPAAGSGTEGAARLIEECFGKTVDDVKGAKAGDPELEAAAQRARKEQLAMRSTFAKGVPVKAQLLVKAPFTENGKTEWMWVEVVTWKGDSFQGTLDNEPYWVKSVRQGSPVTVPFAQVADYIYVRADGSKVGGYSNEILQQREGSR
jgi:uncharacterized protein YegJ (DUF2314 family)